MFFNRMATNDNNYSDCGMDGTDRTPQTVPNTRITYAMVLKNTGDDKTTLRLTLTMHNGQSFPSLKEIL